MKQLAKGSQDPNIVKEVYGTSRSIAVMRFTFLIGFLLLASFALGQAGGVFQGSTAIAGNGNVLRTVPHAQIVVCGYPSSGSSPCTNTVTTYTTPGIVTACPLNAPVLIPGTTTCSGTSDAAGNFSFIVAVGQNIAYYFKYLTTWYGPYVTSIGIGGGAANFASPPPLGNVIPNTVDATTLTAVGDGLFFQPQSNCIFTGSDPTLHEVEDVSGKLMWLYQGLGGPCTQILNYTPLPDGVNPSDKQVIAYDVPSGAWTVQTQSGGLADPGSNGIIKRTALNTTAVSTSADIISLFSACSGVLYLGADGACHAAGATPGGSNTQLQYNNTGALGGLANVATGSVLASQGVSTLPAWLSAPAISAANMTNIPGAFTVNAIDYGVVGDDSTDNCTAFTNMATAVNAITSSGPVLVNIALKSGGIAYKTSCGMNFTVPVTIIGGATIDAAVGVTGAVIDLGLTGRVSYTGAPVVPFTVQGMTFIGGSGGAVAIVCEPYVVQCFINYNQFLNFGTSASTSMAANAPSPANEIQLIGNTCWSYDGTTGRNCFKFVDTSGLGSVTVLATSNHILSGPTLGLGGCGGFGLWMGGTWSRYSQNTFYGFNKNIRVSVHSAVESIFDNVFDTNQCVSGSFSSNISLGDAGVNNPTIYGLAISHNTVNVQGSQKLLDKASDAGTGAAVINQGEIMDNVAAGACCVSLSADIASGTWISFGSPPTVAVYGNRGFNAANGPNFPSASIRSGDQNGSARLNFMANNFETMDIGLGSTSTYGWRLGTMTPGTATVAPTDLGDVNVGCYSNGDTHNTGLQGQCFFDFGKQATSFFDIREGAGGTILDRLKITKGADVDYSNGSGNINNNALFGAKSTDSYAVCETAGAVTTLSTVATTTNTGLNCLPANAIIDAVLYRITTTITTAASFTIGDATTAARFCSTQSTLTSGTTGICFVQADQTGAAGPRQTAAAAVRVTTNVNPGAGAIRLVVYYHTWTAPTS